MNVYIARQPIFDRYMNIYGYELLYRKSDLNYFPETNDNQATAELIYNSYLVFGLDELTDGTKAFINFSKELITGDMPLMLPKETVVFEILEREKATQETLDACTRLKESGFSLALDDFVFDEDNSPLLEIADIIKVEYPAMSKALQRDLLKKYKHKSAFLAEKIETREEFREAKRIGYDLFQGYFFSKPSVINMSEIVSLNAHLLVVLNELSLPEPNFAAITEIIQGDLGLSFKILKLVNSTYMGVRHEIKSILHAIAFIGISELKKLINLMLLKDIQNIDNAELVKLSLVRGKFMSLLATELKNDESDTDYFFAGLFSMIDVLLSRNLSGILDELPLSFNVKAALMGTDNNIKKLLDCVIAHENAKWIDSEYLAMAMIGTKRFMELYIEALKWVKLINY